MKKITVIIAEPNKLPFEAKIVNGIRETQKIVEGRLETVTLDDGAVLVCNEEAKLIGLEYNRILEGDFICGTFFISGYKNERLTSLSESNVKKWLEKLSNPIESTREVTPKYIIRIEQLA